MLNFCVGARRQSKRIWRKIFRKNDKFSKTLQDNLEYIWGGGGLSLWEVMGAAETKSQGPFWPGSENNFFLVFHIFQVILSIQNFLFSGKFLETHLSWHVVFGAPNILWLASLLLVLKTTICWSQPGCLVFVLTKHIL